MIILIFFKFMIILILIQWSFIYVKGYIYFHFEKEFSKHMWKTE
jgi:hypothetical protein